MTLNSHPSYPADRGYVLRLHRDARSDELRGRLEHLDSGRRCDFTEAKELIALLAAELAADGAAADGRE